MSREGTCLHRRNGELGEPLFYKPDWPRAQQRWTAFWELAPTDRPLLDVRAPRQCQLGPLPRPPSLEAFYLDPDCVAERWKRILESTYFGGEAVPTGDFLMGSYALGCGPDVVFAPDTVWHPVRMSSLDEPVRWDPGPGDRWTQKLEEVVRRLLGISHGEFLVGYVIQVPPNDLLMLLRGTADFLAELAQDVQKCRRRLKETFDIWVGLWEHFRGIIDAEQAGCVWAWPGLWHPDMVMVTQSDMSCMISADHFERYVLYEMDLLGERFDTVWYHLDGPLARRHVPALLSRPYVRAVQYVPGAGQPDNGPAHMELYRCIQAAGRCLDIWVPREHVEYVVRRLRPEGLIVRTWVDSREQADEMLDRAVRWCGTHLQSSV